MTGSGGGTSTSTKRGKSSASPTTFASSARSNECGVEAVAAPERGWWGTQFHPEEFDPEHPAGERVLQNFFELARSSPPGVTPLVPSPA
jgi:GMP synthase-like glutamine amidotransferase